MQHCGPWRVAILIQSGQARTRIKWRVLTNRFYKSLLDVLAYPGRSMNRAGNLFEHLCWHAFEQDRGEFVLAVVWQAANRCVHDGAADSGDQHPTADSSQADCRRSRQWRSTSLQPAAAASGKTNTVTYFRRLSNRLSEENCVRDHAGMWTVRQAEHELPISDSNWAQILEDNSPPGRVLEKSVATFFPAEADPNQDDAPRLDIVLTFSDGITVRHHPKAELIWSTQAQPTAAMQLRIHRAVIHRARVTC